MEIKGGKTMSKFGLEIKNKIAYLTLQNPPANTLSTGMIESLHQQLDRIEEENVKAVLVTGEGRFFSAGADIKEFTSLKQSSNYQSISENGQNALDRIENSSIPFIAAINGPAFGGGLELAMACHIRIVTEDVKLGLPEITLGIIPGFAGTQRLPRFVGTAKAYELMLTGEAITANEAQTLGLANRVVKNNEDLEAQSNQLVEKIASMSKPAIQQIMHLISFSKSENFDKGVKAEAVAFEKVFGTADSSEGIQAFLEKRKPTFQDI